MSSPQGSVLVIDDVVANLTVTAAMLARAGYEVVKAASGAAGLAAARARPFDLILLDVQMPEMDGWTVCRRLKEDPATRPVPVIFMTAAYGEDVDVIRGLELGGSDYVSKPVHPRILVSRVNVAVAAYRAELAQRRVAEERAEALAALRAAQAQALAAHKLAGLATMARGLAHEINNPLAAALGDLEYVLTEGACAPAGREVVAEAAGPLRRVAAIVARMRRLGDEIDTGGAGSLDDVVRAACKPLAGEVAARGILGSCTLDPTPPVAGAARLAPVVVELITNAARSVPPGGHISVRTFVDGDAAALSVEDDGAGMTPEERARAFDPFFTSKKEWSAVGMGLAMCHSVVTSLGGTIDLASEPGRGAKVTVRLPLAAAEKT